ncbi:MAG: hypothetical protein ACQEV0_10455 [Bacillota bacterium]
MPTSNSSLLIKDPFVMNEDTVNEAVWNFIKTAGFHCPDFLTGNRAGVDVEGKKGGWRIYIESKGSHANAHDLDTVFDSGQIKTHTYMQIGKLMEYQTIGDENSLYVMANPDIPRIRNRVDKVMKSINYAGFVRFWIREDGRVEVDYPIQVEKALMEVGLIQK